MPDNDAPLEELLEAAEAAVTPGTQFQLRTLVLALVTMVVLLVLVSVTLAGASGGSLDSESHLLELVVPRQMTPDRYRSRIQIRDAEARFIKTPFGTHEVQLTGTLDNHGNRVLSRADLVVTITHLFRDTTTAYSFSPVTPGTDGVPGPGPLLARSQRDFQYRIPDYPGDVERRDVRIRWEIGALEFHTGLPIPVPVSAPVS